MESLGTLERAADLFSGAIKHPDSSRKAAYSYQAWQIYESILDDGEGTTMIRAMMQTAKDFADYWSDNIPVEDPTNITVDIVLAVSGAHRKHLKIIATELYEEIDRKRQIFDDVLAEYGQHRAFFVRDVTTNEVYELPKHLIMDLDEAIEINSELVHVLSEEENLGAARQNLELLLDMKANYA